MREDVKDFLNTATKLLNFLPDSYSIFIELQNLLSGKDVTLSENMSKDNPICAVLFYIILAFIQQNDSAEDFARKIYKAKLIARDTMLFQFETFADLLIAYAYIKLDQYKKASTMIYEIIKTAKEKGMNSIVHIGWYIMSLLNIKKGEFDIAFGVLNNSNIQMEKSGGFSEYLTMLNKISMYKVLMHLNSKEQAQICLNQALNIIQKFGINLKFNIDNENIMLENSSTEEKSV
jgi:ATP/maltotriose-dependent transcriptional regulator MalT